MLAPTERPPVPQQQVTAMDAATQKRWDDWCDSRVMRLFDCSDENGRDNGVLGEALAEALVLERQAMRGHVTAAIAKLAEQVGELRAEVAVLQGIMRSSNVRSFPPVERARDVAV